MVVVFEPILVPKPWGGFELAKLAGSESSELIGELWLYSNIPGKTTLGDGLSPEIPVLLKILETKTPLSLQVHPTNEVAMELEQRPDGKTEAWYVLGTVGPAKAVLGLKDGASADNMFMSLERGEFFEDNFLRTFDLSAGDVIPIPAGMIHATDGHLLFFEAQQSSDFTYRIYDYGRGRELHLEKAKKAVIDHRDVPERGYILGTGRKLLFQSRFFIMEELNFSGEMTFSGQDLLVSVDETFEVDGKVISPYRAAYVFGDYRITCKKTTRIIRTYTQTRERSENLLLDVIFGQNNV